MVIVAVADKGLYIKGPGICWGRLADSRKLFLQVSGSVLKGSPQTSDSRYNGMMFIFCCPWDHRAQQIHRSVSRLRYEVICCAYPSGRLHYQTILSSVLGAVASDRHRQTQVIYIAVNIEDSRAT